MIIQLFKGERKKLQEKNLELQLNKIKPNIIHVQWPSVLPWVEPYFNNSEMKVVLSQRGFHTNVRPFVKQDNFNYLEQCYPQLDGLHSVSRAISEVGKNIGEPKTRIDQVVYTGLDLSHFEKIEELKEKNELLNIISVGRPHWKKGYSYAIRAMQILKTKGVNFKYEIIGGQADEEITYLIQDLGLSQEVILQPKMEQQLVFEKMKNASLFLLPSLEEGIANVAVESMALGTPVISTTCGGMNELIIHGENGFLVPSRNSVKIAIELQNFKTLSLVDLNTIRLAARRKIEEQFSESKMVKNMSMLYKNVMRS
jgi:colanic acid/amylovoran biosynthesis glycosyltransferase